MTIQQFIEEAEEGGYRITKYAKIKMEGAGFEARALVSHLLLQPAAWKAVGRVEGWDKPGLPGVRLYRGEIAMNGSNFLMHRMVDALAEGKSVEEFLATL